MQVVGLIRQDQRIGRVYEIRCNITGEVYYGSTTKNLEDRLVSHRTKKNKCTSKKIIERENYSAKTIERIAFTDKSQLREREAFWIKNNMCVNKNIPSTDISHKCVCTGSYTNKTKSQHFKSQKHQFYAKHGCTKSQYKYNSMEALSKELDEWDGSSEIKFDLKPKSLDIEFVEFCKNMD